MKLLAFVGAISMIVISLSSCKKGENDPSLSLRTRKARVTGEWELTSMSYTVSGDYNATGSYSGGTKTETNDFGGPTVSYSYAYSMIIEFVKDGSYKIVETDDGDVTTYEGIWAFSGKSKDAELKNKEGLVLSHTKISYPDGTFEQYNKDSYPQEIWILDQLSNKKIVAKTDDNVSSSSYFSGMNTGSSTNNYTSTQTFEKK